MPKRSNEFQKLVRLVKEHAGEAATVTESKLLYDRVTKKEREVDICIESQIGEDEVVICVECRDHGRPADITWVEQLKAKHEHLPTNKLILASSTGFTLDAEERARFYGFDPLFLDESDDNYVSELISGLQTLVARTCSLTPTAVKITVSRKDSTSVTVNAMPDNLLYDLAGNEVGNVKDIIDLLGKSDFVKHEALSRGSKDHKGFAVVWSPVRDAENNVIFTMREEVTNDFHEVESIEVLGSFDFEASEFALRKAKLGNIEVAWARGELFQKPSLMVASSGKLSVHVGNPGKATTKRSKRRSRNKTRKKSS